MLTAPQPLAPREYSTAFKHSLVDLIFQPLPPSPACSTINVTEVAQRPTLFTHLTRVDRPANSLWRHSDWMTLRDREGGPMTPRMVSTPDGQLHFRYGGIDFRMAPDVIFIELESFNQFISEWLGRRRATRIVVYGHISNPQVQNMISEQQISILSNYFSTKIFPERYRWVSRQTCPPGRAAIEDKTTPTTRSQIKMD